MPTESVGADCGFGVADLVSREEHPVAPGLRWSVDSFRGSACRIGGERIDAILWDITSELLS